MDGGDVFVGGQAENYMPGYEVEVGIECGRVIKLYADSHDCG